MRRKTLTGGWDSTSFTTTISPASLGQALVEDVRLARALDHREPLTRFIAAVRLHAAVLKVELLDRTLRRSGSLTGWQPILDASGRPIEMRRLRRRPSARDHASALLGVTAFRSLVAKSPAVLESLGAGDAERVATRVSHKLLATVERELSDTLADPHPRALWYAVQALSALAELDPENAVRLRSLAREWADALPSATLEKQGSRLERHALALDAAIAANLEAERVRALYRELRDGYFDPSFRLFRRKVEARNGGTKISVRKRLRDQSRSIGPLSRNSPARARELRSEVLTDVDVGAVLRALASASTRLDGEEQQQAIDLLHEVGMRSLFGTGLQRGGRVAEWTETVLSTTAPYVASAVELSIYETTLDSASLFPGDFAHARVSLQNTQPSSVASDVTVVFEVAPELRFVGGSARIDGRPTGDPVGTNQLLFTLADIPGGSTADLTFALQAIREARPGTLHWTAHARAQSSPAAGSELLETPPSGGTLQLEDFGSISGTVWLDTDGDGRAGALEPGVPQATVLLDDGTARVTDQAGSFHIDGLVPATYQLTLAEESLPSYVGAAESTTARVTVTAAEEARIDLLAPARDMVTGVVFRDLDGDLRRSADEPIVAGAIVETVAGERSISDRNGRYLLRSGAARGHEIRLAERQPYLQDTIDLRLQPLPEFVPELD